MRKTLLAVAAVAVLLLTAESASADHYVNGYYRSNGTYVQGHMQSDPDGNPYNNYSTQGNVNPYTGQPGTHNPNPYTYHAPTYTNPYRNPYATQPSPSPYANPYGTTNEDGH